LNKIKEKIKTPLIIIVCLIFAFLLREVLAPFLFAFFTAFLLRKLVCFIEKATGLNSKISGAVCIILCYAIIGVLCFFIFRGIFAEITKLIKILPDLYDNKINPLFRQFELFINKKINGNIKTIILQILELFKERSINILGKLSESLTKGAADFIINLPDYLTTITVSVIASFFICIDYKNIIGYLSSILPEKYIESIKTNKNIVIKSLLKLIYSYFLIFVITFAELLIGLWLLKVDYVFVISFLIAVADIFPIIGTATILIPWSIISLIKGNIPFAIGVLSLSIIIMIVRNIIEPKILGKTIGVHPLITLLVMYLGFKVGGVICAVIFPFLLAIINELCRKNKRLVKNNTTV